MVRGRKGTHQGVLDEIQKSGFVRARVDGTVYNLSEDEVEMDRYVIHHIEAVVDRLVIRKYEDPEESQNFRTRLTDSVETALKFGDGYLIVSRVETPGLELSAKNHCQLKTNHFPQIFSTPSISPAPSATLASPKSSRVPFRSIPPTEPAPTARVWAVNSKSMPII